MNWGADFQTALSPKLRKSRYWDHLLGRVKYWSCWLSYITMYPLSFQCSKGQNIQIMIMNNATAFLFLILSISSKVFFYFNFSCNFQNKFFLIRYKNILHTTFFWKVRCEWTFTDSHWPRKKKLKQINYQTALSSRCCHTFIQVFCHLCIVSNATNVKKKKKHKNCRERKLLRFGIKAVWKLTLQLKDESQFLHFSTQSCVPNRTRIQI